MKNLITHREQGAAMLKAVYGVTVEFDVEGAGERGLVADVFILKDGRRVVDHCDLCEKYARDEITASHLLLAVEGTIDRAPLVTVN